MSEQCIVHGCTNKKYEGKFIGDICYPCYLMITKGKPEQMSTNFIHRLYRENRKLSKTIAQHLQPAIKAAGMQ